VVDTDIYTKKKRSEIMSKIRGSRTGIEITLQKALRKDGLKGFKYQPKMFGKPDFAFEKNRVAIFCDGSFWHGYRFKKWAGKLAPFWLNKISSNIRRDTKINRGLRGDGWRVLRFWDWEIEKNSDKVTYKIMKALGEKNEKNNSS